MLLVADPAYLPIRKFLTPVLFVRLMKVKQRVFHWAESVVIFLSVQ